MFLVVPLKGIVWNGRNILFGDSKDEVEQIFGKSNEIRDSYYYFNNELRFDFDEKGKVVFIEFLGGIDGNIQPIIYGTEVFQCSADQLYELLKKQNNGEIEDSECGYAYAFMEISVGIYRESIPEDVLEFQKEPLVSQEDVEYEKKKAFHWATLGIGTKDYYRK